MARYVQEDIAASARRLVEELQGAFVMATVTPENAPHVFYMGAMMYEPPATLYVETFKESRKVGHIRRNPRVELLFARPDYSQSMTITGLAELETSRAKMQEVWDAIPASQRYFSSIDDPGFAVIKVVGKQVRLWVDAEQREPYVLDL